MDDGGVDADHQIERDHGGGGVGEIPRVGEGVEKGGPAFGRGPALLQ